MSFVLGSGAIILDKIYLGQRRLRLYYGVGIIFFAYIVDIHGSLGGIIYLVAAVWRGWC